MRFYIVFAFVFLGYMTGNSQQLSFESGKTISSFDYKNSQGETLDNLQSSNHNYLSLGYRTTFFLKGLFININGNFYEYGAIGSDIDFDNYYEWDMSYLGLNLGFDYEIFKPGNFTVFIKASVSAEFLIQGTQTLNNQVYSLTEEKDFEGGIYVLRGGLGVQYRVSPTLSVFTQYMYGTSNAFKDGQGDLKIKTHNIGLGLLINISKKGDAYMTATDNAQIEELKRELETNSMKIEELEKASQNIKDLEINLANKENEILQEEVELDKIKKSIENALKPYQGNDISIEERKGQVHIVMERDLLFKSGSYTLDNNAMETINDLGDFLAENPDLSVIIEGHADDAAFIGDGLIDNNWDLSSRRASSIVQILEKNKNINPKNLIVAGRAEYDPIADNTTAEGKAKNRRITFIISPNLEELLNLTKD